MGVPDTESKRLRVVTRRKHRSAKAMQSSKNLCLETAFGCMARQKKCNRCKMLLMPCQQEALSLYYDHNYVIPRCVTIEEISIVMLHRGRRCKVVQTIMCQLNETQRNTLKSNSLREF